MLYKFKTLTLHNFLSFGDSTISLTDKNYCLIKGINKNPSDRALSNGAGKSSIINAICWVLTGQTLSGLKSNIENIFIPGGCFVSLEFEADGNEYIITRYKNHEVFKTDLKISLNGDDISGKGIRESENILAQYLPNLTSDLISSVILLGQNLPNSFTKNTPSGRKELLEKLTESDFMIQDIKDRLNARVQNLTSKKRLVEDELIAIRTKKELQERNLEQLKQELQSYSINKNFDDELIKINAVLEEATTGLNSVNSELAILESQLIDKNNLLNGLSSSYITELNALDAISQESKGEILSKLNEINVYLNSLNTELVKLQNIKDVCPTCGQKLPGISKPDTSKLEQDIKDAQKDQEAQIKLKENFELDYKNKKNTIETNYNTSKADLAKEVTSLNTKISEAKATQTKLLSTQSTARLDKQRIEYERNTFNDKKKQIEDGIATTEQEITTLTSQINDGVGKESDYQAHLEILNKINTLVKRDFRGYLLLDIISFLDKKAKEYCRYLFNTNALDIQLNANNIDITFCGKDFDNLSGGEKKKVDCIIQFAIRSLMSTYFNFKTNVIFLDEIFDELDYTGCNGIINLISNVLNDTESVFIISHHSDELEIPVDSTIIVEKNEGGISKAYDL